MASKNKVSLRGLLERIDHLVDVSRNDPEFSDTVPWEIAEQIKILIRNAFNYSAISHEVLDETFITVLNFGALQIEWINGPNTVEVMIDREDTFSVLYWNKVSTESVEYDNVKFEDIIKLAEKHLPNS